MLKKLFLGKLENCFILLKKSSSIYFLLFGIWLSFLFAITYIGFTTFKSYKNVHHNLSLLNQHVSKVMRLEKANQFIIQKHMNADEDYLEKNLLQSMFTQLSDSNTDQEKKIFNEISFSFNPYFNESIHATPKPILLKKSDMKNVLSFITLDAKQEKQPHLIVKNLKIKKNSKEKEEFWLSATLIKRSYNHKL